MELGPGATETIPDWWPLVTMILINVLIFQASRWLSDITVETLGWSSLSALDTGLVSAIFVQAAMYSLILWGDAVFWVSLSYAAWLEGNTTEHIAMLTCMLNTLGKGLTTCKHRGLLILWKLVLSLFSLNPFLWSGTYLLNGLWKVFFSFFLKINGHDSFPTIPYHLGIANSHARESGSLLD